MKVQAALLAAVTAGVVVAGQANDTGPPSEVPFYGLSPPVYPTREFPTTRAPRSARGVQMLEDADTCSQLSGTGRPARDGRPPTGGPEPSWRR